MIYKSADKHVNLLFRDIQKVENTKICDQID